MTGPTTDNVNPFKQSYRERLRKLGGQYKPASIADRCERSLAKHQEGVDFERARAEAIHETRTQWHPAF